MGPLWGRERWLLLLSLLGLLFVILLLDRLALGVQRLGFRVLTLWVVDQKLKGFTGQNVVVHLSTEAVGSVHVLLLDVVVISGRDELLKLVDGVLSGG